MPVLNQGGQFASTTQAQNLEVLHKTQFSKLVDAWEKYHLAKLDITKNGEKIYKNNLLTAHTKKLIPLTAKWLKRQAKLEKIPNGNAKFSDYPISTSDWLKPEKFAYLQDLRNRMSPDKTGYSGCGPGQCQNYFGQCIKCARTSASGIGFIPLIIWAVVLIAGAFTATEIVDEMNTTTEEQAELTTVTNNFCADNQLTSEQCAALLAQQTEAASGDGGFPWIKVGLIGAAAFFLFPKAKEYVNRKRQAA